MNKSLIVMIVTLILIASNVYANNFKVSVPKDTNPIEVVTSKDRITVEPAKVSTDKVAVEFQKDNLDWVEKTGDKVEWAYKKAGSDVIKNFLYRQGNNIVYYDDDHEVKYIHYTPVWKDSFVEVTYETCVQVSKDGETCLKTQLVNQTVKQAQDMLQFTENYRTVIEEVEVCEDVKETELGGRDGGLETFMEDFPVQKCTVKTVETLVPDNIVITYPDNYDPTFGSTAISFSTDDPLNLNRTGYTVTPSVNVTSTDWGNSSFWNWDGNGLVAYWDFNLNNTNQYDLSNNNNNLTAVGSILFNSTGFNSPFYESRRPTNYGFYHNLTSLNTSNKAAFTVSAWFFSNDTGQSQDIISRYESVGPRNFRILITGRQARFLIYPWNNNTGITVLTSSNFLNYTWYMITGVFNGKDLQIYVNGTFKANQTDTSNLGAIEQYPLLRISSMSTNNLMGGYDNIMIWNRNLSAQEISELYNSTIENRPPRCLPGMPCNTAGQKNFTVVSSGSDNTFSSATSSFYINEANYTLPASQENISLSLTLSSNSSNNQSIAFSWSTVGNYTGSLVYRNSSLVYNFSTKSFTDTGLTNNTGYYYNLTVYWNDTISNSTTFTIFTTQNTPCTPIFSCVAYGVCNTSNLKACVNVSDLVCGTAYTGQLSNYNTNCTYCNETSNKNNVECYAYKNYQVINMIPVVLILIGALGLLFFAAKNWTFTIFSNDNKDKEKVNAMSLLIYWLGFWLVMPLIQIASEIAQTSGGTPNLITLIEIFYHADMYLNWVVSVYMFVFFMINSVQFTISAFKEKK